MQKFEVVSRAGGVENYLLGCCGEGADLLGAVEHPSKNKGPDPAPGKIYKIRPL